MPCYIEGRRILLSFLTDIAHFIMQLIYEKYKKKAPREKVECENPKEYCKFRTACLIHFIEQDKNVKEPENGNTKLCKR